MAEDRPKKKRNRDKEDKLPVKAEAVIEVKAEPFPQGSSVPIDTPLLDIDPKNAFQGILWAEILAKPRSMRKGRWQTWR